MDGYILVNVHTTPSQSSSNSFSSSPPTPTPIACLFFSGLGTLIFYVVTGGRVPSYVGSSFGFIGVVTSVTGYAYSPGASSNPNLPLATGGILVCGVVYGVVGLVVMAAGYRWIELLMPPGELVGGRAHWFHRRHSKTSSSSHHFNQPSQTVVTGAVVMTIGVNLSSVAIGQASGSGFDGYMAFATVLSVALINTYAPAPIRRLSILFGALTGYLINLFCGLGGAGPRIDYAGVAAAPWVAPPKLQAPKFSGPAISTIAPVCIVLVAENIGHVKAVGAMTGRNLDRYLGRAFLGDAIATIVSAAGGGTGTTTYAENIGVMAVTKIFSTLVFIIAALVAIILGFIPKFGAVIHTIPTGVFGGLSIVLFGLIAVTGARIWVENSVDFSDPRNLLTAGISMLLGAGMTSARVVWGPIQLDGIGVATFSAIILYQLLRGWGE
ncbi:permease family-domain-containing protein [Jimgerdemannia flammicorona]|uniref:Permease family-domain-containing protein n=1 Tax=Jimgerdemannia flammicorona TaxID=994334 RepID=A0A433B9Z2_9FUNG|nr:permease family-domain-containing protein [Jimgerdemannia flammicorona]